ncbi:hypothetical protein AKO1_004187, partial [Acrasis kona]
MEYNMRNDFVASILPKIVLLQHTQREKWIRLYNQSAEGMGEKALSTVFEPQRLTYLSRTLSKKFSKFLSSIQQCNMSSLKRTKEMLAPPASLSLLQAFDTIQEHLDLSVSENGIMSKVSENRSKIDDFKYTLMITNSNKYRPEVQQRRYEESLEWSRAALRLIRTFREHLKNIVIQEKADPLELCIQVQVLWHEAIKSAQKEKIAVITSKLVSEINHFYNSYETYSIPVPKKCTFTQWIMRSQTALTISDRLQRDDFKNFYNIKNCRVPMNISNDLAGLTLSISQMIFN